MPPRESELLEGFIDHDFVQSVEALVRKQRQYALLWAIRTNAEGVSSRDLLGRRLLATVRNAIVKGALFRGGLEGWRLSAAVARYHEDKHRFLAAVRNGEFREGAELFAAKRLEELFRWSEAASV